MSIDSGSIPDIIKNTIERASEKILEEKKRVIQLQYELDKTKCEAFERNKFFTNKLSETKMENELNESKVAFFEALLEVERKTVKRLKQELDMKTVICKKCNQVP
jgi:tRNA(Ile2) C34 agmatinyltransferase TiaS